MSAEPYSEQVLAHQCPIDGISQWQDWNDVTGEDATKFEMDLLAWDESDQRWNRLGRIKALDNIVKQHSIALAWTLT